MSSISLFNNTTIQLQSSKELFTTIAKPDAESSMCPTLDTITSSFEPIEPSPTEIPNEIINEVQPYVLYKSVMANKTNNAKILWWNSPAYAFTHNHSTSIIESNMLLTPLDNSFLNALSSCSAAHIPHSKNNFDRKLKVPNTQSSQLKIVGPHLRPKQKQSDLNPLTCNQEAIVQDLEKLAQA